jgi:ubiquinone/menaquinone biosynthesis C-methylase UbiE
MEASMETSEAERQVLIACKKIAGHQAARPSRDDILGALARIFGDEALDAGPALSALEERGLLLHEEEGYALSEDGLALASRLDREFEMAGFDDWLMKSEASPAYAEYCRRAYGTPFVQFGMTDLLQLEELLARLSLSGGESLVDLGCGVGSQAEYLADRSGARVLGVDFAPGAISRAAERSRDKRDRLSFAEGDLNAISLPRRSFDVVLSFDSLYFVDDLAKTLADMAALLAPGGRLALFYSEVRRQGDPDDILEPRGTRLGRALSTLGLEYETVDFTESERRVWERSLAAATDLKAAFEAEGNAELWKSRDEEDRSMLEVFSSGSSSRYLYLGRA